MCEIRCGNAATPITVVKVGRRLGRILDMMDPSYLTAGVYTFGTKVLLDNRLTKAAAVASTVAYRLAVVAVRSATTEVRTGDCMQGG